MIEGRIEAFEFMARKLRTKADEWDTVRKEFKTRGTSGRSIGYRKAANECEYHAKQQTALLIKLLDAEINTIGGIHDL